MRVPRFQVKVASEGSEGSEVKVPCVSEVPSIKVPSEGSEGSEVPSKCSVSSVQKVPSLRVQVKVLKVPSEGSEVPSEGSEGSK